jgi:hypothetical protein
MRSQFVFVAPCLYYSGLLRSHLHKRECFGIALNCILQLDVVCILFHLMMAASS